MKHFTKYLPVLLILAMACGSDDDKPVNPDTGVSYFPLRKGFYQIHKVSSTTYKQGSDPVVLEYEQLTEVIDSLPNPEGGYTYKLYRSTRTNENEAWKFKDTWSAFMIGNYAVVREENTPFAKLQFPAKKGNSWDGNMYNSLGEDKYKIESYDEPAVVNDVTFDKTITVMQEENDDPIVYTDLRKEIYARDAGLIYKETTQLAYCTTTSTCLGKKIIDKGLIYKEELKSYGTR